MREEKYHRRSIRLPGYDYAGAGWYFVTICAQNRECLFGQIENGQMILNQAGLMVKNWWFKISEKFPNVVLDEFVVMPNHLHGVIVIVGATPRGRPNKNGQPHGVESGQPHGVAPTLGDMMDWFKTMTTNDYIRGVKINQWSPFNKRFWQRNYFDHIIRDEKSYWAIREYIFNNPLNWKRDEENPS